MEEMLWGVLAGEVERLAEARRREMKGDGQKAEETETNTDDTHIRRDMWLGKGPGQWSQFKGTHRTRVSLKCPKSNGAAGNTNTAMVKPCRGRMVTGTESHPIIHII